MILEHLLPAERNTALLPNEQRIAKLSRDYWIGYDRAEQALKRLEWLLNHPRRVRMPNMLIVSQTNNGKTMIVEKFRRSHLPYQSEDGNHEIMPVLMMQMPSSPTIPRFYGSIITSLGSPITTYTSTAKYEAVAMKLLRTTKTKILIIDELHNMLAGDTGKQREFLNLLRFIGNELQLSIVGVGTKDAYFAIRSDHQLENRFEPFVLPLWSNDGDLIRLLESFKMVLPLRQPSLLPDPDIRTSILERTEGTIGEIAKLLTEAACEAIRSGKEYIDKEILEATQYNSPTERRRLYEGII